MLTAFMISRPLRRWLATAVLAGLSLTIGACQKVPLLAPSGSTITLTAASTALSVNGTTDIIAQVIEAAGTPPQDGTVVIFTTTLGSIEPSEARTERRARHRQVQGRHGERHGDHYCQFRWRQRERRERGQSRGRHRGRRERARLRKPDAAAGDRRLRRRLPARLSTSTAIRSVLLRSRSRRPPERWSRSPFRRMQTASRPLFSGPSTAATVTVAVGAQAGSSTGGTTPPAAGAPAAPAAPATTGTASGSVTVNVTRPPTLVITAPATAPSAGLPASFTFAVTAATTNGSAIRDVTVNWGDGQSQDLGAIDRHSQPSRTSTDRQAPSTSSAP